MHYLQNETPLSDMDILNSATINKPCMPDEAISLLESTLDYCTCFAEYGCGGSTVLASQSKSIHSIISVESDRNWASIVQEKVPHPGLYVEYVDIGPVIEWGTPANDNQFREYWKYSAAPWLKAQKLGVEPELVLIDGRFRVACFLLSLMTAKKGTVILFDDYAIRPEYHIIEKYCKPTMMASYMAQFVVPSPLPRSKTAELCIDMARYSIVTK